MAELPTGTVTFLFTDIEGSTTLAQQYPAALPVLLAGITPFCTKRSRRITATSSRSAAMPFARRSTPLAMRSTPRSMPSAACSTKHGSPLPSECAWDCTLARRKPGASEELAGGYAGYSTLARTQRVMSIAHGGQVLLSDSTAELLRGQLPAEVALRDMKEHRLKGLLNPEHLWQIIAPGLQQDFPPLQSLNKSNLFDEFLALAKRHRPKQILAFFEVRIYSETLAPQERYISFRSSISRVRAI